MKHLVAPVTLTCLLAAAFPAAAAELKLSMESGRVTLIAQDVPVRQILQEWARVGQTKIVNGEKISGPPVSLQLVNVPEKEALDILLRSASGYMAAPRPDILAKASMYDRIMIMPTSRAPMASASAAPAPTPFTQRPPMPVDDDDEPVSPNMPGMGPNGPQPNVPGVNPFPGAQAPNPYQNQQQPTPYLSNRPGVPVGTQQTPGGQPMPNQPTVVKPVGPGGGGEGGPGATEF
jgi:hypothetical protein